MRYSELTRNQKSAIKKYQEYKEAGFNIVDKYGFFPDNNVDNDLHIEEKITTPWYLDKKPVEVYADVNAFYPDGKCENIQFMVDGKPLRTYKGINRELKFGDGELIDQLQNNVSTDEAVSKAELVACIGIDVLNVPSYEEFMTSVSYTNGFKGRPMPTEQDYINNLEDWGDALTDPRIIMCGKITRIEDLHIACETAPHFNGGRGGNGVIISPKLKEYLAYGKV